MPTIVSIYGSITSSRQDSNFHSVCSSWFSLGLYLLAFALNVIALVVTLLFYLLDAAVNDNIQVATVIC